MTLCFVSSQKIDNPSEDEFVIADNDPQFPMTGLKVSSKVRVTRIVTLERRLLSRRLGKLSNSVDISAQSKTKTCFSAEGVTQHLYVNNSVEQQSGQLFNPHDVSQVVVCNP